MTDMTNEQALELLNNPENDFDCSPIHEALIGQTYISDIWAHSNAVTIIFHAAIHKQFLGVMHKGFAHERHWVNETTGFIEDGEARKGELVSEHTFDSITEALNWVNEQTLELLVSIYGQLDDADNFAA